MDTEHRAGLHGNSAGLDFASVQEELTRKAELRRGDFSHWRQPGGRYRIREELVDGEPARVFLFRLGSTWYVGYKTLSDYVLVGDMPGLFCSRVYWHNVVGLLDDFRVSATDVTVCFVPQEEGERREAFEAITDSTPIVHPFAKHEEQGREESSSPGGWPVTDQRAASLDRGEEHIRHYTKRLFSPAVGELTEDVVAFDPACSTGRFLAAFADINPKRIRTIGQDLSREMVEHAATRLENVHHGDAMRPRVARESIDILFCRFLNSEVVPTQRAREILPHLVAVLRSRGTLVLLGHSPVLLDVCDLESAGLRVLQTTARQDDYVFQYFVCEKER